MTWRGSITLTLCVIAISYIPISDGFLEPIQLPERMRECFAFKSFHINGTDVPGRKIQNSCIRDYAYSVADQSWVPKITKGGVNYINSLMRQIIKEMEDQSKLEKSHKRKKRHASKVPLHGGPVPGRFVPAGNLRGGNVAGGIRPGPNVPLIRYRQEVRRLTRLQWRRYTNAVNRLKRTIVDEEGNSAYDLLSFLHSGSVIEMAHGGPNFPGWHRWYLLILETALGVPIPYWDSSMDNAMVDPTASSLWTSKYFGNGDGAVLSGPYAGWMTVLGTPLMRNIGTAEDSLVTKRAVALVVSRKYLVEITEPKSGEEAVYSLEGHHNGVHNWVGGHMAGLNTAAYEPVFFHHHCFIDYIWAVFRERQKRCGIDPSRDYPLVTPVGHEWSNTSDFLPFYGTVRNIEGVSERLARLVVYERAPSCPHCGSEDLYCDLKRWICVPRVAPTMMGLGNAGGYTADSVPASAGAATPARTQALSFGALPIGPRFRPSPFRDPRARNPRLPITNAAPAVALSGDIMKSRARAATAGVFRKKRSTVETNGNMSETPDNKPIINTFLLDGVDDISRWAFVAVDISFKRTTPNSIRHKLAVFQHCENFPPNVSKIFVSSDGLDYSGKYTDYVITDNTKASQNYRLYVGVKNPKSASGQFLLTSYDFCGRICRPSCLVPKSYPPVYKKCTGAFRVTSLEPKMYTLVTENKRQDALQNQENMLMLDGPNKIAPVKFICDYEETWPWSK